MFRIMIGVLIGILVGATSTLLAGHPQPTVSDVLDELAAAREEQKSLHEAMADRLRLIEDSLVENQREIRGVKADTDAMRHSIARLGEWRDIVTIECIRPSGLALLPVHNAREYRYIIDDNYQSHMAVKPPPPCEVLEAAMETYESFKDITRRLRSQLRSKGVLIDEIGAMIGRGQIR